MKKLNLYMLLLGGIGMAYAQNSKILEYQVKAAFLFNFAKFVEWPEHAFADSTAPIVIGIIGVDPFGNDLDSMVVGQTIRGRNLEVKRFRRLADLQFCHILFISASELPRLKRILEKINNASVLTVSEVANFTNAGGIINMFNLENKVRFAINLNSAAHSGIKISSRLLKLAENITFTNHSNEK